MGITIPASGQITIESVNELLWAGSSDLITHIGNSCIIVNDGTKDLTKSEGINLIKGIHQSLGKTGDSLEANITNEVRMSKDDFRLNINYQGKILEELKLMNRILMEALDLEDME